MAEHSDEQEPRWLGEDDFLAEDPDGETPPLDKGRQGGSEVSRQPDPRPPLKKGGSVGDGPEPSPDHSPLTTHHSPGRGSQCGGPEQSPQDVSPAEPPRPPGPGLPESLGWMAGVFAVQVGASIALALVVVISWAISSGASGSRDMPDLRDPRTIEFLQEEYKALIVGGTQLIFVLTVMAAAVLRLGRDYRRKLPLAPIPVRHGVLMLFAILPVGMLSGHFYWWASQLWQAVKQWVPQLSGLDDMNSIQIVESMARDTPLPLLLMAIAVAPAIGEELVFRGVIGRGLLARWGLVGGVLLTSLLFAAMHLHPAHAVALLPLAVFLHVIHIATRSLWAPVLVHFVNNALAAVLMRYQPELGVEGLTENAPLPPVVFAASALCVVALVVPIWQTRVRYLLPDGTPWSPGYLTVERPPEGVPAAARSDRMEGWMVLLAAGGVLAFVAALLYSVLSG